MDRGQVGRTYIASWIGDKKYIFVREFLVRMVYASVVTIEICTGLGKGRTISVQASLPASRRSHFGWHSLIFSPILSAENN